LYVVSYNTVDNNDKSYEDYLMMVRVMCRNVLENVKHTISEFKAGSTN